MLTTNGPFTQATLPKKNCLMSKWNKQDFAKQNERAKQNFLLVLKEKQKSGQTFAGCT